MRMEVTPPVKLDLLDKRIVAILQQNARVSITTLSKSLQRPKATIAYHLEHLEKEKVIREYRTHFSLFKPHLQYALFFLHIAEKNLHVFQSKLALNPHCFTLFSTSGTYNTVMGVVFSSLVEQKKISASILEKGKVSRHEWVEIENISLFPLNYTAEKTSVSGNGKENSFQSSFNSSKKKEVQLEPRDISLLSILSNNARAPIKELVEKTGMRKERVKNRINHFIESGIITKFSATINPYSFDGMHLVFLLANMSPPDRLLLRRFIAREGIGNGFLTLANPSWNVAAFLHFSSKKKIIEFENNLGTICPSLQDYRVDSLNQQHELNWFPVAVKEELFARFSK